MVEERVEKAKARYDKKRPVLSVRVSEAQKKQVEEMASACSKSVGRLVREGLDLERKDWREAYRRGFDRGCEETRKKYAVRVPCVCGHSFPVTGEDRVQEVEDILMAHCNWYHRDCKPDEVPRSECRLFKNLLHKTARQQESRPHGETP